MAKKKDESIVEKVKDAAESIVEEISDKVKEVVQDIKEKVEEVVEGEKEINKKSAKKTEDKEEKTEKKKSKLEELKEKAKALEKKVTEVKKLDIKGEVRGEKEDKKDLLVPIEDYLKASIHLGTRVITPHMKGYVYRRRADGLAVFNTELLDKKIMEGAEYLAKFSPEKIIVVCKREAGWKAVNKFSETLGIKAFNKKYPAGIMTNVNLDNFIEPELVIICDPWLNKNALDDANRIGIPVLGLCDTNNYTFGINQIIPGNNKSAKSLGMILYLLTKLYIEKRKLKIDAPPIQEFIDDWDNLQPAK